MIRIRIPPPSGKPRKCCSHRERPLARGLGCRLQKVRPGGQREQSSVHRPASPRGTALTSPSGSGGGQAGQERGAKPGAWSPIPPGWTGEGQQVRKRELLSPLVLSWSHLPCRPQTSPPVFFPQARPGRLVCLKAPTGPGGVTVTGQDAHTERTAGVAQEPKCCAPVRQGRVGGHLVF